MKPKILYISPIMRYPAVGGPALRVLNSLKALKNVSELHLIACENIDAMGGANGLDYFRNNIATPDFVPSVKLFSDRIKKENKIDYLLSNLSTILKERTYRLLVSDASFVRDYYLREKIDIIWFGFGNISYDLIKNTRKLLPKAKIVCDTDSVWSRFIMREIPFAENDEAKREIERKGLKKAEEELELSIISDLITAVSEIDAQYYRGLSDPGKVEIFSNVIDAEDYSTVPAMPDDFIKPAIYLSGTFWKGSPMESAARWTIDKVWPILRKSYGNLRLYIVGKNSDKILSDVQEDGIIITGEVESTLPYLYYSDLAIVPLHFESGTRFKILEAGICKLPVVSTTLGAEGLPTEHGKHILIADSPQEFADAVISILNSRTLYLDLTENLKKLIATNYSIPSLEKEALKIIDILSK